ncbi:hypothetical protein IP92_04379 [Pseudoduganella flava]|uniref:Uncharacterized protein n=1 Tax=Pseudoduganella flava TaxID=871742 RepID=A0A562PJ27_9BURK|nr:hypothetical protein IP92_04379 [Pseudoduganella flava]
MGSGAYVRSRTLTVARYTHRPLIAPLMCGTEPSACCRFGYNFTTFPFT